MVKAAQEPIENQNIKEGQEQQKRKAKSRGGGET